jgi:hypothetical protein
MLHTLIFPSGREKVLLNFEVKQMKESLPYITRSLSISVISINCLIMEAGIER